MRGRDLARDLFIGFRSQDLSSGSGPRGIDIGRGTVVENVMFPRPKLVDGLSKKGEYFSLIC